MRIALIGYGKMGKTIERLATAAGDEIVLVISSDNRDRLIPQTLRRADVAIEFTDPESAFDNVRACIEAGVPVVCGTTGWLNRLDEARNLVEKHDGAMFYAANFSIGVNIFLALNRFLASLMAGKAQYSVRIEEVHHTEKKDAPSGTAISLARGILGENQALTGWVSGLSGEPWEIPIQSIRQDPAPGTHRIIYESGQDRIEITHEALSREGFARGAIEAAHWLAGKKGFFDMKDMLG